MWLVHGGSTGAGGATSQGEVGVSSVTTTKLLAAEISPSSLVEVLRLRDRPPNSA